MTHRLVPWLLALAALSFGPAAVAHKPSDAYLTLQVADTQIDQRLDVHLRDLDRELVLDHNDDGRLQWAEVRTRWEELQRYTAERVRLSVAGQPAARSPPASRSWTSTPTVPTPCCAAAGPARPARRR